MTRRKRLTLQERLNKVYCLVPKGEGYIVANKGSRNAWIKNPDGSVESVAILINSSYKMFTESMEYFTSEVKFIGEKVDIDGVIWYIVDIAGIPENDNTYKYVVAR